MIAENLKLRVNERQAFDNGPVVLVCVDGSGLSVKLSAQGSRAKELREVKEGGCLWITVAREIEAAREG